MTTNLIKQITKDGEYGVQVIKMIVRSNERGPKGDKGDTGSAATIEVGNVYTVPAGSNAEVMNTGTTSDAVFDFYIPEGATGAKGDAATVQVGSTDTLPAGYNAIVENVGTTSSAVLNFKIPRGATGAQGPQGPQGLRGPKGDTGDTGPRGATGADGRDGVIQYTAGTGISINNNVISATGGGGGGDSVYSTKTTSNSPQGGAVYIGDLDATQTEVEDPTTTDNHYKYFWALPFSNNDNIPTNGSIAILGDVESYPNNPGTNAIAIGSGAVAATAGTIAIGAYTEAVYKESIAIGKNANTTMGIGENVAIGPWSGIGSGNSYSVALGFDAKTTRSGEVNIGTGGHNYGYNNTDYRVLGGLHDAVNAHDAVTKGQLDSIAIKNAGTPTTTTVGSVGQLLEDTTNGKLYQCTAVDTTDPQNPSYTWSEVGAGGGGGPTVVQTTGTSTTDVMSQDATTHMVYSSKNPSTWNSGGVIYLGNLDANQAQQPDPTATAHSNWKYFWALPINNARVPQNGSINILGDNDTGDGANSIIIGSDAHAFGPNTVTIGENAKGDKQCVAIGMTSCAGNWDNIEGAVAVGANSFAKGGNYAIHIGGNSGNSYGVRGSSSANSIVIGKNASITDLTNSVALGSYAKATRQGEVNVGLVTGETTGGYNHTAYRVIGGVHDPVDNHDAATKGYVDSHAGGSSPVTLLTSADNNYDSSGQGDDPDSIAAWLLNDGWYIIDSSTNVYLDNSPYMAGNGNLIQVMGSGQYILSVNGSELNYIEVDPTDGTAIGGSESADGSYSPLIVNFWDLNGFYNSVMLYGDSAPGISTNGALGQLFTDTTTLHTYQCTAIDNSDPSDIQYTWTQRW